MDDGKAKPPIRCFRKVMNGGTVVRGFLRDGVVYINEDLATGASVELRQTVLEEVAHYLTGSKDETRDLQRLGIQVRNAGGDGDGGGCGMMSPYWNAVRHGKAEYWYRSSGAFITTFRHQGQLYRSDCRRRTSERTLRKQSGCPVKKF